MDRQEIVTIISIVDFVLAVITILHETLALIFGSRSSFKVKMLSSPHSDNLTFINHGLDHKVTSSSSDTAESLAFILMVFVVYGIFITQLVMAAKLFLASKKMRSLRALKRVILFSCWRIWSCVFLFLLFGLLTVSIVMSLVPPPATTSFQPSTYSNSFFHKYNVELSPLLLLESQDSQSKSAENNHHHDNEDETENYMNMDNDISSSTTRIKWSHWLLWSILSIQIMFRIFAIVFIGLLNGKLKECLVHPAFAMPSPRPSLHPQAIDIQIQIPKKYQHPHLSTSSVSATTTLTPTPISSTNSNSASTSFSELRGTPTHQIILPSTLPCSTPLRPLYHNYKL